MVATISENPVVNWWVRSAAPWTGEIFQRAILQPEALEEQRIQHIREAVLERYQGGKWKLSMHKARLVTASYTRTQADHRARRRAEAIDHVFRHIPIDLLPGQLLMGTASSGPGIVEIDPEFLRFFQEWHSDLDHHHGACESLVAAIQEAYLFPPEDQRYFEIEVWPYWKHRCRTVFTVQELQQNYPEAWRYLIDSGSYWPMLGGALYHTVQDYASILKKGLNRVKEEIRGYMAELDAANPTADTFERRNHYQAMLVVADGLIAYAHRCADLADTLAEAESDSERAAELRQMACICRKVPAQPAENWWEALQSLHFLRLGTALAEGGNSHSVGRFDQYMYPYLYQDLASGRLSKPQAQELLECLFLKWNETQALVVGDVGRGMNNNDKINLGGMDHYGRDCTNDLSYMLLEAHAHVHLNDPNLAVRLHHNTPDDFLKCALQVVRLGGGLPILINDEVIVPALVSRCGVALEHARHYADLGCQENVTDPNMTGADTNGRTNAGWFNLVKPVELALYNGINPMHGKQVGPCTGDPRRFTSMEQFMEAVTVQLEHAVAMNVIMNNVGDFVFARYFPCVFHNLMHPGPQRTGVDINAGGCLYNWTGALGVGTANAGDCLAAIDNLIFQTKATTWDELLAALEADWEGYEDLRRRAIQAPKYGCDNDYADGWTKRLLDLWFDAYERHTTPRGGRFVCGLISMGSYLGLGELVGATPDGRKRGEKLADSTSPSPYAPAAGPTATHRSAAKAIDTYRTPNGITFNQRFTQANLSTERDLSKWADLVRTYIDAGGQQGQYTVVDSQALRLAQERPQDYKDLIVRVGGYSARFVELSKELQDSIIARAEQQL